MDYKSNCFTITAIQKNANNANAKKKWLMYIDLLKFQHTSVS